MTIQQSEIFAALSEAIEAEPAEEETEHATGDYQPFAEKLSAFLTLRINELNKRAKRSS